MEKKNRTAKDILLSKNWLLQAYREYKYETVLLAIVGILQCIFYVGIAWCIQTLTNKFYKVNVESKGENFLGPITKYIVLLTVFTIASSLLAYYLVILRTKISTNVVKNIKTNIFTRLQHVKVATLDDMNNGELVSKSTSDVLVLENFFNANTSTVIYTPVCIVILTIFMLCISAKLYLASCLIIPVILGISGLIANSVTELTIQLQTKIGKSINIVMEAIAGVSVIKAYNLQHKFTENFRKTTDQIFASGLKIIMRIAALTPLLYVLRVVPNIVCIICGGYLINKGKIGAGDLLAFLMLLGVLANHIYSLPNILIDYFKADGVVKNIRKIYDLPTENEGYALEPVTVDKEAIELKNVSFSYDNNKQILSNINLSVEKNKTIAIVGESGGGKSTILKLLLGYYATSQGEISIDGIKMNEDTIKSCREKVAFVSQDTYLFPDTILNNILCAYEKATKEEVIEAAKKANIHEFIMKLEKGYDTYIAENGANFSGGEKQRISIARALLKPCSIVIFDEPTSAVDVDSERKILDAIGELKKQKTVLLVSHRLSTIEVADEIFVLKDGEFVERGTYDNLINSDSQFRKMYANRFVE